MYPNGYTSPAYDEALPKDTASPHLTRLGKRVKELREKKGLTQTDLAQASGVSRVYISGIERGIRNLTVLHLIGIAKGLRVPPGSLIDLSGSPIRQWWAFNPPRCPTHCAKYSTPPR